MFTTGHISPNRGKTITTQPIRGEYLQDIRQMLQGRPRDLALWSIGVNTALRVSELLSLKWQDLEDDGERISFRVKASKTGHLRLITLNPQTSADLRRWRAHCECEFIASGQRGRLTSAAIGRMVKQWAADVGAPGQVSSHSLRKSACRAWVDQHSVKVHVVQHALGHASEAQTLKYIGKLDDDVAAMFECVV